MRSVRQSGLGVVAALSIALGSASLVVGQSVSEPALKAAFVYNFAKFTEWPVNALPDGGPLMMCVVGDEMVAQSLEAAVKGRRIGRHPLTVQQMKMDGPLRTCHLLYAGDLDRARAAQLVTAVKGAPVLTVSDLDRFTAMGGTAQLFIDGGRMRFAINSDAAQRAGLRLSSQLLALARIVKDDPDARPH